MPSQMQNQTANTECLTEFRGSGTYFENEADDNPISELQYYKHLYHSAQDELNHSKMNKKESHEPEPGSVAEIQKMGGEFVMFSKREQKCSNHDTAEMKTAITNWLNYNVMPIPNPLLDPSNHNNCGIQQSDRIFTMSFKLDWGNLDVRAKIQMVQHPDCSISSSFFIQFLYPKNFEPNLEDLEAGFLTGGLLVKAFKYIFTSPNLANDISLEDDNRNSEDEDSKPAK
ncbi:hypothetical protein BDQ17DRAFT_1430028 [Cyathus striatus]|nr:hypothetical protein BDQ17DRAFT_1430028 [Cyathus striatus]